MGQGLARYEVAWLKMLSRPGPVMSCRFPLDSDIMVPLLQETMPSEAEDAHSPAPFCLAHVPFNIPYSSLSDFAQKQGGSLTHGAIEDRESTRATTLTERRKSWVLKDRRVPAAGSWP